MSVSTLTNASTLLSNKGELVSQTFEKKVTMPFNKQTITNKLKIKEWDNYVIQDNNFFVSITVYNLTYLAEVRAIIVDLRNGFVYQNSSREFNPQGKVVVASDFRKGVTDCKTSNAWFRFEIRDGERYLKGAFKNFYKNKTFTGDLEFDFKIHSEPKESVVSSYKFKNRKRFIYSQKINDLDADGTITINGKLYTFDKDLTFASCLLARGAMPYKTVWDISAINSKDKDGNLIAFNLGRILGLNDKVEENVILYNGLVEKISNIRVYNNKKGKKANANGSWTFYSEDGKLELCFEPLIKINQGVNLFFINNKTTTILGSYSGKIILDNGQEVELDRTLGFSESVRNRW